MGRGPENFIHAMVVTSQKVVELMGRDLSFHFTKYKVSLVNIADAENYGPDAITLVLAGKENDIKKSLSHLRKICEAIEAGIEFTPIRSLPPVLKGYLQDMENNEKFEKLFSYCREDYLNFCKKNNVTPHPEVVEENVKSH